MIVEHNEWQWCSILHGVVFSSLLLSSDFFYSTPLLSTPLYFSLSTLLFSPPVSPHVLPTSLYFIFSVVFSTFIFRSVILCLILILLFRGYDVKGADFDVTDSLISRLHVRQSFFLDDILLCKYSVVYLHCTRTVRTYVQSFIEILDFLSPDSTSSRVHLKKTSWLL